METLLAVLNLLAHISAAHKKQFFGLRLHLVMTLGLVQLTTVVVLSINFKSTQIIHVLQLHLSFGSLVAEYEAY